MKTGLLKDAAGAGLFNLPHSRRIDLPRLAAAAQHKLLLADLGDCKGRHEALSQLGKDCQFPVWYGANLDALHDCLTDPGWQPRKGVVLQISGLDSLRAADPEAFSTLIEVLQSAASIRSAGKTPLWILLTSPAPGISDLPEA